MNRKTTKTVLFSAMALSAAFAAQGANAALITSFDYTVDSGFSDFTSDAETAGAVTGSENNVNGNPTQLSWGSEDPQSNISITPQVAGNIETNGPAEDGATFTHVNNQIPTESSSLSTFDLSTELNLTSATPASEAGYTPELPALTFNSSFTETDNSTPCAGGGSVSVCDDIFVLDNADDIDGTTTQTFSEDGIEYAVKLDIMGLGPLTGSQCDAAGAQTNCVGFTTLEDENNAFGTEFTITAAQAVPEPSTLAMMGLGLGLVGFGVFSRRRNLQA